jgi:tRNA (guanine26-N2/guanine27-N2)-dimethyltransferase
VAKITEYSSSIDATLPDGDVHRQMEVFYNPLMVSNRNISILLLNSITNENMKLSLPLTGSGIRALRFLQELNPQKMSQLVVNDFKDDFKEVFNKNLKLNSLSDDNITICKEEASLFLLNQQGFDYIDLDPFGSPNPFLPAAMARISRKGILAVTATDTAALTGTYPKVTKRKYWSRSLKNHMMHEIGLRILIRKIQLQGIQFEKALTPILAYHKDHYFRIYFKSEKGKQKCDKIIKKIQYLLFCGKCLNFKYSRFNSEICPNCNSTFDFAGPLWVGELFDKNLITRMKETNKFLEDQKFLDTLEGESIKDLFGFYDLHSICKRYKFESPKLNIVLKKLEGTRTHFSDTGFKTEKDILEIVNVIKSLQPKK